MRYRLWKTEDYHEDAIVFLSIFTLRIQGEVNILMLFGHAKPITTIPPTRQGRIPKLFNENLNVKCREKDRRNWKSKDFTSADHPKQDDDDGDNQQDVDQSTSGDRSDHAEKPKDNEYDSKGIEHDLLSNWRVRRLFAGRFCRCWYRCRIL